MKYIYIKKEKYEKGRYVWKIKRRNLRKEKKYDVEEKGGELWKIGRTKMSKSE